jgi:hypothetical protein
LIASELTAGDLVASFLYYNGRQNFNSLVVFPTPSRLRWALLHISAAPLLTSEGGIAFPRSTIDEVLEQTGRDLARFDLDLDLPGAFSGRISLADLFGYSSGFRQRIPGKARDLGQFLRVV